MDLGRQARVRAKDLIRSNLEKWTLKGSVCVGACARVCQGCAEHEVTDWEVTPLISVLFSRPRRCCRLWKATKKQNTPARARSTYDNCLDESLEAALTFKKKRGHACIHHWGRKEELLQLAQRDSLWEPETEELPKDGLPKLHGLSLKDEITEYSKDGCFLQDTWCYICKHFHAVRNLKNRTRLIHLSMADRRQRKIPQPAG